MPSRDDGRNDTAACPACGQLFTRSGRRRWCSDACRQAAWRRRHPAAPGSAPAVPAPRPARDHTVYECPERGERYLGQQRCDDCGSFCQRVGPGGACPHCDGPVAVADLAGVAVPAPARQTASGHKARTGGQR
jgi:hypothetical protein